MFLTDAKFITQGNKAYSPVILTNENGKGKVIFEAKLDKTSQRLLGNSKKVDTEGKTLNICSEFYGLQQVFIIFLFENKVEYN